MRLLQVWTVLAGISFASACSSPPPPPPAKTVFDPLTQQLDRAKDVQTAVDAKAEATRKAVEEEERGDHSD